MKKSPELTVVILLQCRLQTDWSESL